MYQDARFGEDGKGLRLLNSRQATVPRLLRMPNLPTKLLLTLDALNLY